MTRSLNSAFSLLVGSAEVNCAQFSCFLNTTTKNFRSAGYENESQSRTGDDTKPKAGQFITIIAGRMVTLVNFLLERKAMGKCFDWVG